MRAFHTYELRTSDPPAARAFYESVLGAGVFAGDALRAAALPAQAAARGAPPHWLGHVGPCDVASVRERLIAAGGEALGPPRAWDAGHTVAGVRDPSGAVLALASAPAPARPARVVWHQLHARDADRAADLYAALFGWTVGGAEVPGPGLEPHRTFAWVPGGDAAGSVAPTALRPGVHPHWLFHFGVDDVEAARVAAVRAGGEIVDDVRLPGGTRILVCHDPQGGAFALRSAGVAGQRFASPSTGSAHGP